MAPTARAHLERRLDALANAHAGHFLLKHLRVDDALCEKASAQSKVGAGNAAARTANAVQERHDRHHRVAGGVQIRETALKRISSLLPLPVFHLCRSWRQARALQVGHNVQHAPL